MLELKYLNSTTSYEVDFFCISKNIIEIQGNFPIKNIGFTLSRPDKNDTWNYSDFTTIYRTLENGVQFSNDESIYVEPKPIPELPNIPFKPYEPTPEESKAIFNKNKINKITTSKLMLAKFLEDNPLRSTAHRGVEGIYSVTSEKQTLMMSKYVTYQIEKTIDPNIKLRWNETGKSSTNWTEEEFLQLVLEIKAYVSPLVSYQQQLEEQIMNCENQEKLDEIVINYTNIINLEK